MLTLILAAITPQPTSLTKNAAEDKVNEHNNEVNTQISTCSSGSSPESGVLLCVLLA